MNGIAIIGVSIIVIAFAITIIKEKKEKSEAEEREKIMGQALRNVYEFSPSKTITGIKSLYTFAIDNDRQKVLYMDAKGNSTQFKFEDIISVELTDNNQVISQKSTGRTVGGAVLGGVLAGGVGALIGGLSGSSKQKELHSSVSVKILLRNSSVPSLSIACFDAISKPVPDTDVYYQRALSQAQEITDTLVVIIDSVDKAMGIQKAPASPVAFLADEIAKLAVLKDKGILTEGEFQAQKVRLLNGVDNNTVTESSFYDNRLQLESERHE